MNTLNCRYCNRSFTYQFSLQRHEQIMCPKRPATRTDALVARSDANALDALTRALDR